MKTIRILGVVLCLFFVLVLQGCGQKHEVNSVGNTNQASSQISKKSPDAFTLNKTRAEEGDATAQLYLGDAYCGGIGVAKNDLEAVKWYRKAADQNNATAEYLLGCCYDNGYGLTNSESTQTPAWDNAKALGTKSSDSESVKDDPLGIEHQKTGKVTFSESDFVDQDSEAVKWWRKAAMQNNVNAQYALALCYDNGHGVSKSDVNAVQWYRKAAENGHVKAQWVLGMRLACGYGVAKDDIEALKWYRKAAEQGFSLAQYSLGNMYQLGRGTKTNYNEAIKWFRLAGEQNYIEAQLSLAQIYFRGDGVPKDYVESFNWAQKAGDQGEARAQYAVGIAYLGGFGVPKNILEAYKWFNMSASRGNKKGIEELQILESQMTSEQIAEAQKLTREYKLGATNSKTKSLPNGAQQEQQLTATGTGFFITEAGYFVSNYHVVKGAAKVRLLTGSGLIDASVVKVDAANDLALLKIAKEEGGMKNAETFKPLPIAASRTVKLGATVATVGFPSIGLQGFAPKLAKGEIASLSGPADDPRYFQISLPVQHGNSGGALVDVHGNVVGIVSARLGVEIGKAVTSDELPENVNYAVKSSLLLSFLESVPDVASKIKEPNTKDEPFEDVVKSAQDAAVLVLVY